MHGQINNLVGVSVFPLRGASWTVLPYAKIVPVAENQWRSRRGSQERLQTQRDKSAFELISLH